MCPDSQSFAMRHYWKIGWLLGAYILSVVGLAAYDLLVADIIPTVVVSVLPWLGLLPLILWGMAGAFPGKVMRS